MQAMHTTMQPMGQTKCPVCDDPVFPEHDAKVLFCGGIRCFSGGDTPGETICHRKCVDVHILSLKKGVKSQQKINVKVGALTNFTCPGGCGRLITHTRLIYGKNVDAKLKQRLAMEELYARQAEEQRLQLAAAREAKRKAAASSKPPFAAAAAAAAAAVSNKIPTRHDHPIPLGAGVDDRLRGPLPSSTGQVVGGVGGVDPDPNSGGGCPRSRRRGRRRAAADPDALELADALEAVEALAVADAADAAEALAAANAAERQEPAEDEDDDDVLLGELLALIGISRS